jgi:ABC-type phosphate/phosphonate transport system substrate-binding protein
MELELKNIPQSKEEIDKLLRLFRDKQYREKVKDMYKEIYKLMKEVADEIE